MSAIMSEVAVEISVNGPLFRETERRLDEWGRASRLTAQAIGYPTSSGISRMIEQVKVYDQLRKGVRKPLKRSRLIKADKNADAKAVSLELRHADPEQSADGKESLSMRLAKVEFSSAVLQVENIVNALENWMQKTLRRSYLFGQPDKEASQDLRMPKERYRDQRETAVISVAEKLATRRGVPYSR
jgi:hypothetical protein